MGDKPFSSEKRNTKHTNNSVKLEKLHKDHTLNKTSSAGNKIRYPFKSRQGFYFL